MQASDIAEVLIAEHELQPSPWSKVSFEESLAREHICRVVNNNDKRQSELLAFHIVCPVADELHILNLVVAKAYQGQGLAHVLMQDIVDIADNNRQTKRIFLDVRKSNEVAQNLYAQWQFKQISLRKDYYPTQQKGREDALILVKEI